MKRKTDDSRLDPATSEFPSWLSGEQRRRLLLACRSFVLLRKAVSVRRNVFVCCCMLRKGRKKTVGELLFREGLACLLDDHVPIPDFARLKMERKRLFNKFFWGQGDIAAIMGKSQSNIGRILQRMKQDVRWSARVQDFRITAGRWESYRDGIFPLILDFCEAECLECLIRPMSKKLLAGDGAQEPQLSREWTGETVTDSEE